LKKRRYDVKKVIGNVLFVALESKYGVEGAMLHEMPLPTPIPSRVFMIKEYQGLSSDLMSPKKGDPCWNGMS
jgi:hypothetical protein